MLVPACTPHSKRSATAGIDPLKAAQMADGVAPGERNRPGRDLLRRQALRHC